MTSQTSLGSLCPSTSLGVGQPGCSIRIHHHCIFLVLFRSSSQWRRARRRKGSRSRASLTLPVKTCEFNRQTIEAFQSLTIATLFPHSPMQLRSHNLSHFHHSPNHFSSLYSLQYQGKWNEGPGWLSHGWSHATSSSCSTLSSSESNSCWNRTKCCVFTCWESPEMTCFLALCFGMLICCGKKCGL
jgi:hypothetical protein